MENLTFVGSFEVSPAMHPSAQPTSVIYLLLRLAKRAGLVQLIIDDGLIQVISLKTKPLDLLGWSPFIHRLLCFLP